MKHTTNIYESLYLVNSFHCVDAETGEVIEADEHGNISPAVGTKVVFPNPFNPDDKAVAVSTLIFKTNASPVKIQINNNEMYPLYIPAESVKGFDYLKISHFTVLEGSQFYVEGLSSET